MARTVIDQGKGRACPLAASRQRPGARRIEVGVIWPHKQGQGFDLVIPAGMAISGRIVCVPPKDEATSQE